MNKLISGYLWAFRNYEAGSTSVNSLRKFYPDSDIFINVDYDGDHDNYKQISQQIGGIYTKNTFQLGYCGDFGSVKVGRPCWSKEYTFEWVRGIYEACKKTDSKYMILLEEDDYLLKPISLLSTDFSMAIHPTVPSPTGRMRPNPIPHEFKKYIQERNGNPNSPGYAAGGGTIFNREEFILAWETHKDDYWKHYDTLVNVSKIIGWADYILQFIMQLNGYEIIQNHQLCEHWEVPNFASFEIITGLKDHTIIKN